MSEATQRPWRAGYTEENAVVIRAEKVDGQPYLAAMVTNCVSRDEVEANASLIVKAVNAHEDFMAGVELMLAHEQSGGDGWWTGWEKIKVAHAKVAATTPT